MGVVYRATNDKNGKVYIGKTVGSLERRRKQHEHDAKAPKYIFHRAIRKYGKDSFTWDVLYESPDDADLCEIEIVEISEHDSTSPECGYNMKGGGLSPSSTARNAHNRIMSIIDRLVKLRKLFRANEDDLLSGALTMKPGFEKFRPVFIDSLPFIDSMVLSNLSDLGAVVENGKT